MTKEQLNQWAENQTVVTLSRLSMLATMPMLALISFFGLGWLDGRYVVRAEYDRVIEQTADTKSRLTLVENNQVRGRADRENFQEQTTATLAEVLRALNSGNERLARMEAQIAAQQRELDRRTAPP